MFKVLKANKLGNSLLLDTEGNPFIIADDNFYKTGMKGYWLLTNNKGYWKPLRLFRLTDEQYNNNHSF